MYMQQGQGPGQQLPQHPRQGMGNASQGDSSGHYISATMGGSNAHIVGMAGAMGPNELGMGAMGVMPSAMMVNGSGMVGTMAQAHAMYSGAEVPSSISAAQAAAAAAQAAAAQAASNPMMTPPSVMSGPVQLAPTQIVPSSQHHQQQMMVHQRSRASATPHHHARAAMAQQRQQGSYLGNSYDASHLVAGTPVSNYADFLSGRSTTPLGHLNGHSSTPVVIRPPSTRAKSVSISSANGRRTPGAPGHHPNGSVSTPGGPHSQQQQPARGDGPRWTELDLGGMNLRALSSALFRYTFMTKLYINHNQLTYIPPAISSLRSLEELDASGNLLSAVPPELGLCCQLKELLLFDNQITDLPCELGTLFQLETLGLEGNPLQDDIKEVLQKNGTRALIECLRENGTNMPAPPDRAWISLVKDVKTDNPEVLTVLSYNVLSAVYATPQKYSYCPSWALAWEYRRDAIIAELVTLQPDVLCLQEVEASQYDECFCSKLREKGYEGVFWTKSRARTMSEEERKRVDGCATFYKVEMFECVASHLLEFQQSALSRKDFRKSDDFFNRFMTKDNIAGFAVLRHRKLPGEPLLFVANAQVHWDPEFVDVKMVQTTMLTEELASLVRKHTPGIGPAPSVASTGSSGESEAHRVQIQLQAQQKQFQKTAAVICADFNSKPESGLYEFLSRGRLDKEHSELARLDPYADYKRHGLRHPFGLKSAYASVGELPLTNYDSTFSGTIDYIWYTTGTLTPTGLLGELDEDWVSQTVGFPNTHIPSDHIPIMAEFKWKPGGNVPGLAAPSARPSFQYTRK
ncbi:Glucose-repressible alcohol dehydrogenase transcriptional effector [Coemansia guatemalensis]|uniref:Glucose-repressible alcohol dehydrogenase transcriptional effector n=1 Tax=Coemansia guatemalensis TaxID=2761395 RepID=A0A9W8HZW7_9FUNG|nr:Glucose-repressible alcohol dehydrogenase transcriptional effector [Coemansia guatemalensis]